MGGPEESEIQLKKGQLKPEEYGKRRGFDLVKWSISFHFILIFLYHRSSNKISPFFFLLFWGGLGAGGGLVVIYKHAWA